MNKLIYLICIISILCIASNCKKELPTYYMPQEFKDYVDFPVGSYWIYEDSITGAIDSVCLIEREFEIVRNSNSDYKAEYLVQKFNNGGTIQAFAIETNPIEYELIGVHNHVDYNFFYKKNLKPGMTSRTGLKYANCLDSINIKNNTFYQVKKFIYNETINYWAKKVGCIYISTNFFATSDTSYVDTNIVWKLKRYHINN